MNNVHFHGTALDAVDWAVDFNDDDPADAHTFLHCWREGDLSEWPEYYEWLRDRYANRVMEPDFPPMSRSADHGTQEATEGNWDGERRARFWQQRASVAEAFANRLIGILRDPLHSIDPATVKTVTDMEMALKALQLTGQDTGSYQDSIAKTALDHKQAAILRWVHSRFGETSLPERGLRHVEEALETLHACLILQIYMSEEYVDTPCLEAINYEKMSDKAQFLLHGYLRKVESVLALRWKSTKVSLKAEIGGSALTLAAIAEKQGMSLFKCLTDEFERVLSIGEQHWLDRTEQKRAQGIAE